MTRIEKRIQSMTIGEQIRIGENAEEVWTLWLRVPGGWLIRIDDARPIFVPLAEEFR